MGRDDGLAKMTICFTKAMLMAVLLVSASLAMFEIEGYSKAAIGKAVEAIRAGKAGEAGGNANG